MPFPCHFVSNERRFLKAATLFSRPKLAADDLHQTAHEGGAAGQGARHEAVFFFDTGAVSELKLYSINQCSQKWHFLFSKKRSNFLLRVSTLFLLSLCIHMCSDGIALSEGCALLCFFHIYWCTLSPSLVIVPAMDFRNGRLSWRWVDRRSTHLQLRPSNQTQLSVFIRKFQKDGILKHNSPPALYLGWVGCWKVSRTSRGTSGGGENLFGRAFIFGPKMFSWNIFRTLQSFAGLRALRASITTMFLNDFSTILIFDKDFISFLYLNHPWRWVSEVKLLRQCPPPPPGGGHFGTISRISAEGGDLVFGWDGGLTCGEGFRFWKGLPREL